MARTHFIIKPRIQFKYMFVSFIVVCLMAVSVYYVFWRALIMSPGMDQLSEGEIRALAHAYNGGSLWVILVVGSVVAIESVFFFHKIIGPIFAIEGVIKAMANGDFSSTIRLRRSDELKDMARDMQSMIENTRDAVRTDRGKIVNVKELLAQGKITQATEALNGLTNWFKID